MSSVCFAQVGKKPLFNNSWYCFATGAYPNGQSPSVVKPADLDNDGDSDLVVAQQNFSNGFVVLINQSKGLYAAPVKYNSPAASQGIAIADFNNDGRKDVAVANTGQYGRYDYWIVKTTPRGAKQWDVSFGGSDDDWLTQLQQTTDGGYIFGGWSWSGSSGDKSQPSLGANDYWIVKTDSSGIKQWDAAFGGSSNDYLNPIQQTTDGGYILGGYSSSPADGDKTQQSQGGTDYWMVKTDAKGTKQWDAQFGGSDFDFCYGLRQTAEH